MIVRELDLGRGGRVQGYYYGRDGLAALAVRPELSEDAKEARRIEALEYEARPASLAGGEKFLLYPRCYAEVDRTAVRAHRKRVERIRPEWVERVRREWETYRDVESTIYWSELEPEPVVAILKNLWERGEIPPDGEAEG